MTFFLIAGERSGDLHGSHLIKALRQRNPDTAFVGYGGDMMEEAGMKLLRHYREISYMGFWEVFIHIRTLLRTLNRCRQQISEHAPDVQILIDFPGFNLKMAKHAKALDIGTAYYIAPKLWAWKKGRIKSIKKYVDKMYCIFPFETDFFQGLGYEVQYVGNPVMEAVHTYETNSIAIEGRKIAFLAGSRIQEIKASTPVIVELARQRPDLQILVAGVGNVPIETYDCLEETRNVHVFLDRTYDILKTVEAAIVTSGTATLETALLGVPQVVCYRTSPLTYFLAKNFVKVKYISLVNLIADKEVVKELIQDEYTVENLLNELSKLQMNRKRILEDYKGIAELLGTHAASNETAIRIERDFNKS